MHEDIPVVRICESPVSMTSKRECFFHTVLAVAAARASAKAGLTGKCSKKLHRRVSHTVVSHPILAQDLVLPRILPVLIRIWKAAGRIPLLHWAKRAGEVEQQVVHLHWLLPDAYTVKLQSILR